jgi:two-component system sensor kinase FixL
MRSLDTALVPGTGGDSRMLLIAAYGAACIALEWTSRATLPGVALWRPAAGLTVLLLVAAGPRRWPIALAVLFAAELLVRGALDQAAAAFATAALSTGAYVLIAHHLGPGRPLESLGELMRFARVTIPATVLLALGASVLDPASASGASAAGAPFQRWLAEVNGILVLVPALLALRGIPNVRSWPAPRVLVEAAAQTVAIGVALWLVFTVADRYGVRFYSALFLPLLWVAARSGVRGTSLALVAMQLGLVVGTQLIPPDPLKHFQLQVLAFALCATGLVLSVFVAQRQRIEARLREKQTALNHAMQLAAAGEMTSALAHELNQPIAALVRYLGACEVLAVESRPDADLLRDTVRKAAGEARRASEVIRRLRDFYRAGAVQVQFVPPLALVESAVQAVRPRAQRAAVRIGVTSAGPLPQVAVDDLQVETALQNLLNNAIDALADAAEPRAVEVSAGLSARGVAITVRDNGPGLPPEVADRLFEPFNTTKAQGLGMGLAISRSLVQANDGSLTLDPDVTSGTGFVVTLPVAAA